jgi:hypothetical protein
MFRKSDVFPSQRLVLGTWIMRAAIHSDENMRRINGANATKISRLPRLTLQCVRSPSATRLHLFVR